MPLSKERNKKRMRLIRLHKAISTPQAINLVQPNLTVTNGEIGVHVSIEPSPVQPERSKAVQPSVQPTKYVVIGGVRYKKHL